MTDATTQPLICAQWPMAYCPIHRRSETTWSRGMTAKESWSDRTTCDSTSRSPVARSPKNTMVITAGTMASARVRSRRMMGRRRMRTNPSITTCPASVPVMVEDWPAAISATAKATGAIFAPSSGSSRRWASWISAMLNNPALKKVAPASTSRAALTSRAPLRAITESMMLKRMP
jgi:hypothetical protein